MSKPVAVTVPVVVEPSAAIDPKAAIKTKAIPPELLRLVDWLNVCANQYVLHNESSFYFTKRNKMLIIILGVVGGIYTLYSAFAISEDIGTVLWVRILQFAIAVLLMGLGTISKALSLDVLAVYHSQTSAAYYELKTTIERQISIGFEKQSVDDFIKLISTEMTRVHGVQKPVPKSIQRRFADENEINTPRLFDLANVGLLPPTPEEHRATVAPVSACINPPLSYRHRQMAMLNLNLHMTTPEDSLSSHPAITNLQQQQQQQQPVTVIRHVPSIPVSKISAAGGVVSQQQQQSSQHQSPNVMPTRRLPSIDAPHMIDSREPSPDNHPVAVSDSDPPPPPQQQPVMIPTPQPVATIQPISSAIASLVGENF